MNAPAGRLAYRQDPLALGVLLAGGRGERLRLGVPKAFVVIKGRTLFERALASLGSACGQVWVAAPAGMELPAVGPNAPRFERVDDVADAGGPLAGIAAVARSPAFAKAASVDGARIVTLAVDMPLVTAREIGVLLFYWTSIAGTADARSALVPVPGGRLQPLAAIWSTAAFQALAEEFARGERSISRAAIAMEPGTLDEAALMQWGIAGALTFDVDNPVDLFMVTRLVHDESKESA